MGRKKDAGDFSASQSDGQGMQNGGQFSQGDRERFQALRDSIQSAHGGKLSQDELRGEMRKMFIARMNRGNPMVQQSTPEPKMQKRSHNFGITSNYPEYQKNAYIPSHQSGRGRVWILKSNGLLEPVFVRTGLNDGRFTEINSPKLKAGDQIVLGVASNSESAAGAVQNPLAGSGGGPGRPGGGFR